VTAETVSDLRDEVQMVTDRYSNNKNKKGLIWEIIMGRIDE
jgi:hypothetical protein